MDKQDLAILDVLLNECKAASRISAVTQKTILSEMAVTYTNLYRGLNRLIDTGYVAQGFAEGREHTYYITENGKNLLSEVTG